MPQPNPCVEHQDQVDSWKEQVIAFEKTGPPKKPNLVPGWQAHLSYLTGQLTLAEIALANCLNPAPPPVNSAFSGQATLYIQDGRIPLPLTEPFSGVALQFQEHSTPPTVLVTAFPPIVIKTNLGTFTITALLPSAWGQFQPDTHDITMFNLPLHMHEHMPFPLPDGDDDISFTLTTKGSVASPDGTLTFTGVPIDPATGNVTLVGAARFSPGGTHLGGEYAQIEIVGIISPVPS